MCGILNKLFLNMPRAKSQDVASHRRHDDGRVVRSAGSSNSAGSALGICSGRCDGGDPGNPFMLNYPSETDLYKCKICYTYYTNLSGHPAIKKHLISHGCNLSYRCGKCDKTFNNIRSISGHYSRCNNGPVMTSPNHDFRCANCLREFNTYPGLRLHMKKAHPVAFVQMDIEAIASNGSVRDRWVDEDIRLLAFTEANLPSNTRFINQALMGIFPCRSLVAIKGQRRKHEYKELVTSYKIDSEM